MPGTGPPPGCQKRKPVQLLGSDGHDTPQLATHSVSALKSPPTEAQKPGAV